MKKATVWAEIASALQKEIALGHYPEGAKLQTEAELSLRFGVNRHTIRRAIRDLVAQGIVYSRRGAGVFVANTPTDYPIGKRVRFTQNIAATGKLPGKKKLRLEIRPSDRAEAEALEISVASPILVYEGLSLSGQNILAHFASVFALERVPQLENALGIHSSVTKALQYCGIDDYIRRETKISAELASATLALHLTLRSGDPVIRSVSINTDLAGNPIEFGITHFAGNKVALTMG